MIYRYEWEKGVWLLVALSVIAITIYYFAQMAWIVNVHGSDDYCSPDDIYCVINGGVYYCKEDMSICDQAKGWLNLTSKDHKFPTEIKNVEWCTSSDYAICKIDGYLVDCEEHVDMCLAASKLLSVEQKQIIENNYVDENGTRLCLGKFCREMVKEFASESAYLKGDYCSSSEAWLNVTHVEYCIVGGKGIQCSEPDEQKICQEHDRRLEKLGQ